MRTGILVGGVILFIFGAIIAAGSQTIETYSSEECPECGGQGRVGVWPLEITCDKCGGTGEVSSEAHAASEGGLVIGGALVLLGLILIIVGAAIPAQQTYPQQPPYPHPQQPAPVYIQQPLSQPVPLVTPHPPAQTPTSPPQVFCGKCGKRIEGDQKFCSNCGESIGVESTLDRESPSIPAIVEDLPESSPTDWMTEKIIFRCPRCDTPAILTEGRFWCNTCSTYCTNDFRRKYPTEVENIKVGMPSEIPQPGLLEKWGQRTANVLMILLILFLIAVGLSVAAYLL